MNENGSISASDDFDALEQEMIGKLRVRKEMLEKKLLQLRSETGALSAQLKRVDQHLRMLGQEELAPKRQRAKPGEGRRGPHARISREKLEEMVRIMLKDPERTYTMRDLTELSTLHQASVSPGIIALREAEVLTPVGRAPRKPGQHGTSPMAYAVVKENADAFLAEA